MLTTKSISLFMGMFSALNLFSAMANPTGLIDDFALGISKDDTPEELIVKRDELKEAPFLDLSQNGNLILKVDSTGNLQWPGILNRQTTTLMGNVSPADPGHYLGHSKAPWTQVYLKELYLPLSKGPSKPLDQEVVNNTIKQLTAVVPEKYPNEVLLKIKPSGSQPIVKPMTQNYFNASHLIPILLKRSQLDHKQIKEQTQKIKSLEEQNLTLLEKLKKLDSEIAHLKNSLSQTQQNAQNLQSSVKAEIDLHKKNIETQNALLQQLKEQSLQILKTQNEGEAPASTGSQP